MDNYRFIGKPQLRVEDDRLLRGRGQFSDDQSLAGQLFAGVLRSPFAHARLLSIDTSVALAIPGVRLVLTGADAVADGLGHIDHSPLPKTRFDLKLRAADDRDVFFGPHAVLPVDKVRHVGEAVAMVVADSLQTALDAVEAISVDYEQLDAVCSIDQALSAEGPPVWEDCPDNVFVDTHFGDSQKVAASLDAAHFVVEETYTIQRVTGVPLEPRSALAACGPSTDRLILHAGSGGATRQKAEISRVLGIETDRLRVLSQDVGGNFGTRNRTYVEFVLVLWAAMKLRLPVKYTATRSESFLSDYQGRDFVSRAALAVDVQGNFLALAADNISNAGARCVSLSPLGKGSALITGSYEIPLACLRARAVFTNTAPTQAYRSSGRPEVTFVIERLIDKVAVKLKRDPLSLRRQNLIATHAMPYVNAIGTCYDSGDYAANMDAVLALSDWQNFETRRREASSQGQLLGRGFANYVESSVGTPRERAEISVNGEGCVRVVIGTQPSGQGHETSFAQVAADLLQIEFEDIEIHYGDTDKVTIGGGSHSGRSMRQAGVVIGNASRQLIELARELAAIQFEVSTDMVEYVQGSLGIAGTDIRMSLGQLARKSKERELRVECVNEMHEPVFPNGSAVCEVAIDPETGACCIRRYASVDDVGRCINPLIVHGQTHGAIAQGVGQAMGEEIVVDQQSGQLLSGSLMDYRLARAADFPMFDTEIVEVHTPTNPLGIKSGGEGGTTPALAAYVAAVSDALADYGVADLTMPVTPQSVMAHIKAAKS